MHKYLTLCILLFLSNNLFSQKALPVLIDTILIVKIFSIDTNNEIMSKDDYFIYKKKLYNNFISSELYCSKSYDFTHMYRLKKSVEKSKFYNHLMGGKGFKRMEICDFTIANSHVFCADTACLNKSNCAFKNCYAYFKEEIIMFSLISCDLTTTEVGNSIHYKFLEKTLLPFWKGSFLIPLAIQKGADMQR